MTPLASLCLVTPLHLANNPRVVKEASSLCSAGYRVRVVAGRQETGLDAADQAVAQDQGWTLERVDQTRGPRTLSPECLHRLARLWVRLRSSAPLGSALDRLAHHRAALPLAAAAGRERADLYLGHTVAGLGAAAAAARRHGTRLGFDAEDFHREETVAARSDPVLRATIASIESRWLPACVHTSAASPLIAQAYASFYRISLPTTVRNVFPRRLAPPAPVARAPGATARRLHWFSQTLGPDRGLETLLVWLARAHFTGTLALRGRPIPAYPARLRAHAHAVGYRGTLEFLPLVPPDAVVRLAAEYDVGLGLEERAPRNRDLCLTNKVFAFLLAGLPLIVSPTQAQTALAQECGEAAYLLEPTPDDASVARLARWLNDPNAQLRARVQAWTLGQTRYCWDLEQSLLLSAVAEAMARPALRPADAAQAAPFAS